jgi:hypothetical protein
MSNQEKLDFAVKHLDLACNYIDKIQRDLLLNQRLELYDRIAYIDEQLSPLVNRLEDIYIND